MCLYVFLLLLLCDYYMWLMVCVGVIDNICIMARLICELCTACSESRAYREHQCI